MNRSIQLVNVKGDTLSTAPTVDALTLPEGWFTLDQYKNSGLDLPTCMIYLPHYLINGVGSLSSFVFLNPGITEAMDGVRLYSARYTLYHRGEVHSQHATHLSVRECIPATARTAFEWGQLIRLDEKERQRFPAGFQPEACDAWRMEAKITFNTHEHPFSLAYYQLD